MAEKEDINPLTYLDVSEATTEAQARVNLTHPSDIGHPAVFAENVNAAKRVLNEELHPGFSHQLEEARLTLRDMSPKEQAKADQILEVDKMPEWLRLSVEEQAPDTEGNATSFVDKLVRKNGDDKFVIDDQTALNVMQWHTERMAKRNEELQTTRETLLASTKDRLQKAVDNGWLEKMPPEKAFDKLNGLTIFLSDGFMMSKEGGSHGEVRKKAPVWFEVVINGDRQVPNSFDHTVIHEFLHILSDGDRPEFHSGIENVFNFGTGRGYKNIDEAVIEHFSSALVNGLFGEITATTESSAWNSRANDVYEGQRYLLDVLCSKGLEPIPVKSFVDAMFEDQAHAMREGSASLKLKQEIERAWPFDVRRMIGLLEFSEEAAEEFARQMVIDLSEWKEKQAYQDNKSEQTKKHSKNRGKRVINRVKRGGSFKRRQPRV